MRPRCSHIGDLQHGNFTCAKAAAACKAGCSKNEEEGSDRTPTPSPNTGDEQATKAEDGGARFGHENRRGIELQVVVVNERLGAVRHHSDGTDAAVIDKGHEKIVCS